MCSYNEEGLDRIQVGPSTVIITTMTYKMILSGVSLMGIILGVR